MKWAANDPVNRPPRRRLSRRGLIGRTMTFGPHKLLGRLILLSCALLVGCVSSQVKLDTGDIARSSVPAGRDTTIALLGATGMVGGYILQAALAEGFPVRVLARTPAKLQGLESRIDIVQGDARDPEAVDELVRGSDVVVTALGPVKSDGAAAGAINTAATTNIIRAMSDHGIRRYIVVSGAAVEVPGDDRNLAGWWMRQLVRLRLGSLLADRQAEYRLLAASGLEWTLVRCPLIDSQPYQRAPQVSLLTPASFHLRAGELADFIVREIDARGYVQRAPFLYSE